MQHAVKLMSKEVTTCMKCNSELRVIENIKSHEHINWGLERLVIYEVDPELLTDEYYCDECKVFTSVEKIRDNITNVECAKLLD